MRLKALILAASFLLFTVPVLAQQTEQGPLVGVIMGSGWINDHLDGDSWGGGFKTGLQTQLDAERGLWLRTVYTRVPFGPSQEVQSVTISAISEWWMGKKWGIFANLGAEAYVDGDLKGLDGFAGFGISRTVWTGEGDQYLFLPQARLFGEVVFVDADQEAVSNFIQLNIGLTFSKPVKK